MKNLIVTSLVIVFSLGLCLASTWYLLPFSRLPSAHSFNWTRYIHPLGIGRETVEPLEKRRFVHDPNGEEWERYELLPKPREKP